jgi:hypothetical protein
MVPTPFSAREEDSVRDVTDMVFVDFGIWFPVYELSNSYYRLGSRDVNLHGNIHAAIHTTRCQWRYYQNFPARGHNTPSITLH